MQTFKINFVTEKSWVPRVYSEEFSKRIPNSTVSLEPDESADVNIFIPYYLYKPCNTRKIAFYTHKEEGTAEHFNKIALLVDYCIAMCTKTANLIPTDKKKVIQVYPSEQFHEEFYMEGKLRFGIVGKFCPSGRKRMEFIEELAKIQDIDVVVADGNIPFEEMPAFYYRLDYLVVISDNEGGPMPVIEALAMHKPVIAPDVGFAWNYPVIRYDGTKEGLIDTIKRLIIPRDGWDNSAKELLEIVNEVCQK